MKLLTLKEWGDYPPHHLMQSDGLSIATRRRLFTLGIVVLPTVQNMKAAAQARGIPGWHNMKRETLMERLNGELDTE